MTKFLYHPLLVLALIYNIYFKNWDMDCIKKVTQTFVGVSRSIYL